MTVLLTVREMLEVLSCVGACLWMPLPAPDLLEVAPPSAPLSRITKSPAGTLLKVTRKLLLSSDCADKRQRTSREMSEEGPGLSDNSDGKTAATWLNWHLQ